LEINQGYTTMHYMTQFVYITSKEATD